MKPKPEFHIVMPMAGKGERFRKDGIFTPKPLIKWQGLPLFWWSVLSLRSIWHNSRWTFVISEMDEIESQVKDFLNSWSVPWRIVSVVGRTKGPAETVLFGLDDKNECLISLDCDVHFSLDSSVLKAQNQLFWFHSQNPQFSYVQATHQIANKLAEKQVISEKALAGCYSFGEADTFRRHVEGMLKQNNEIYLSHVIQSLIESGEKFYCTKLDRHFCLGTPEDLKKLDCSLTNENNHMAFPKDFAYTTHHPNH